MGQEKLKVRKSIKFKLLGIILPVLILSIISLIVISYYSSNPLLKMHPPICWQRLRRIKAK